MTKTSTSKKTNSTSRNLCQSKKGQTLRRCKEVNDCSACDKFRCTPGSKTYKNKSTVGSCMKTKDCFKKEEQSNSTLNKCKISLVQVDTINELPRNDLSKHNGFVADRNVNISDIEYVLPKENDCESTVVHDYELKKFMKIKKRRNTYQDEVVNCNCVYEDRDDNLNDIFNDSLLVKSNLFPFNGTLIAPNENYRIKQEYDLGYEEVSDTDYIKISTHLDEFGTNRLCIKSEIDEVALYSSNIVDGDLLRHNCKKQLETISATPLELDLNPVIYFNCMECKDIFETQDILLDHLLKVHKKMVKRSGTIKCTPGSQKPEHHNRVTNQDATRIKVLMNKSKLPSDPAVLRRAIKEVGVVKAMQDSEVKKCKIQSKKNIASYDSNTLQLVNPLYALKSLKVCVERLSKYKLQKLTQNSETLKSDTVTETVSSERKAPLQLLECNTKYGSKFILKRLQCKYCERTFVHALHLGRHMRCAHKKELLSKSKAPPEKSADKALLDAQNPTKRHGTTKEMYSMFHCILCDALFPTKNLLKRHQLWEHDTHMTLHKCQCGRIFYQLGDLEAHLKCEHKSLQ